ncbi:hypothetical protein FHS23_004139 [Prauserella isguenensis]|uniref:DUF2637 domain-containing protein n=1 Tax=Prauserella isguenensis TaxID=1470180 RepID=A0A839S5Q4_9PSEU|nr:hypothetical protein [Prauserella isguenensis]MBB3053096.1 hypothetical protein [Prauserella isguenensis]
MSGDGSNRVAADGRPPGPARKADVLVRDAADAAELRAHQTDPDVVALRVERVRTQVDRLCWAGIVLGLAFTMTNVQSFAAGDAGAWSLPWLAAWLLDPTVSLVLLAILRAEQVTARYQIATGPWVRRAKWFTLSATYVMNTWEAYANGSPAGIVLHSVPPLLVFVAAEAVTDLRDKLTDAVNAAVREARREGDRPGPAATEVRKPVRRKLFNDYLDEARQAWTPEVVITPAWIREATGCSRGLSSRLAEALAAEVVSGGDRP